VTTVPFLDNKAEQRLWLDRYYESRREVLVRDPWGASGKHPAHPNQQVFIDGILGQEYDTVIHFGSARAGKSVSACLGLLQFGYRYPGCRILVGRYTFRDLDRSTMVSMGEALGWIFGKEWGHIKDVTPRVGRWEAQRGMLTLRGGPKLEFQHFKDAGQLGSTEYALVWIEEAQEIPGLYDEETPGLRVTSRPEVLTMIDSRLNKVHQSAVWGPSKPTLALTAMGWGHNWVYDMGIADPGPRTLMLESNAEDNRENIPQAWFDRMEALPKSEQARYLFLSHEDFSGRAFPEFGEANVLPRFLIPKAWPMIRAHDPGVTGAGWVWMSVAVDVNEWRRREWPIPKEVKDGDVITWDEYAPRGVPIEKQIAHVVAMDEKCLPLFTAIDPADARQQTGSGVRNTADLIKRAVTGRQEDYKAGEVIPRFGVLRKSQSDERAFILKAKQLFFGRRHWVLDKCKTLIRQLTDEAWDEKSPPGERKRKYAGPFHVLSAFKYGIMLEPEILAAKPTPVRRGKYGTRSRTGY